MPRLSRGDASGRENYSNQLQIGGEGGGGAVQMKRWQMIRMGKVFNAAAAAAVVQLTHARQWPAPSSSVGIKALPHPTLSLQDLSH